MVNGKKVLHIFGIVLTLLVVTLVASPFQASYSSNGTVGSGNSWEQAPSLGPQQLVDPTQAPPDDNFDGVPPVVPGGEATVPQDRPGDNYDGIPPQLPIPSEQVIPLQTTPDNNNGAVVPTEEPISPQSPSYNNTNTGEQPEELRSQEGAAPSTSISVDFPATGDTFTVLHDPYWWNTGDRVDGYRVLGLNWVSNVLLNLQLSNNTLNGSGHVDLDLSINGIIVGSFTVLPGETSKSVSFSFPSISGPGYTIRLRETNTVVGGGGSIVLPLNASTITFVGNTFPATGDTLGVANDPYWWTTGDYALGTRTPGIDWIDGITYNLLISNNYLGGTGHVDFDLSINKIIIGSFTVLPGETSKTVSFSFPSISGPVYTIRLEETNTVDPGMGSIVIPLNNSLITFRGNTFPATGDTLDIANSPYWWLAGDYALGTRMPGPDWVTGVAYDLILSQNVLYGTGHVDFELSINGIVVGHFTVQPNYAAMTVAFAFPKIYGPNYVIKLEEINTVEPGKGSIVIPLNTSTIHLFGNKFPADGDTINIQNNPYWWHVNDGAVGSRRLDMGWVSGVTYNLQIINNVLTGTGHVDLEMYINNILVGNFTVLPGEVTKTVSFNFPVIQGPDYTVWLKETNLVDPGMGSIVIPLNKSTISFRTSIFLPNLRK